MTTVLLQVLQIQENGNKNREFTGKKCNQKLRFPAKNNGLK